jgi:hypothetical protein
MKLKVLAPEVAPKCYDTQLLLFLNHIFARENQDIYCSGMSSLQDEFLMDGA